MANMGTANPGTEKPGTSNPGTEKPGTEKSCTPPTMQGTNTSSQNLRITLVNLHPKSYQVE